MSLIKHHKLIETNVFLLVLGIFVTVIIGGLVEIVPLFSIKSTIENVQGVRPYTPLEVAGRDIYVREGCYNCHSQMVRPFRDEIERYGHYSLAAESKFDHPFQWGSKRTGPDLARVGGKYSNEWHVRHLINPRAVVPESIMPGYPHLAQRPLAYDTIDANMRTLDLVDRFETYSQVDGAIENAVADLEAQATPDADTSALVARYSDFAFGPDRAEDQVTNMALGDLDGNPDVITEMDALVAYLQVLGTMVDFTAVDQTRKAEWIR
ncbi:cytochrome-c oxidase, cbb3-type subunit II [Roseospira marina]|uniref:Cytochrome-c oxidase, cbb3-type subunit II n=1 Tax=Roseospira marina TaxID=140057 RepID=A0A5M6I6K0_9PROT|nr:cytochrome-c oxidase, cbb3-type subunit II [Roseospira marina]KAA5603475.1 cytochrome-c oxidase, cbb3-type subunit II [Roseospira marina]MBB4316148.1 cytochrome c oxidase cbb3-type subunit 2 [Roseospira marina]MBB5089348.1 cytochrome c oxidase cbb3-type subunit 2 [Roseospira marina]